MPNELHDHNMVQETGAWVMQDTNTLFYVVSLSLMALQIL